jgi:hypothetical protein
MLKLISFTIILFLFATGSYAQTQFNQHYESLSQDDKKIVDSVRDVFLKNHIIFLDEFSQANKFIGAAAKTELELITEDLPESHYELGVETHKKEHLVLVILPVEKGSDGTYHTPTAVLGGKVYTFKVLYTVGIQGKNITVGCSKLSDDNVNRIEIAPNQKVIKEIAEDLSGTVSDNIITLP